MNPGKTNIMATIFGTAGNDNWTIAQHSTIVLDGLGGIDTLYIGSAARSSFEITLSSDGAVHIDTLSGASQPSFYRLYNIEFVGFDNRRDLVDLRSYFGDVAAPTATFDAATAAVSRGAQTYTLRFSETVTGLSADDFLTGGGSQITISGSGAVYLVTVTPPGDFEGVLPLTLKAGAVEDSAGNINAQHDAPARNVDARAPQLQSSSPANGSTVALGSSLSLSFSEPIQKGSGSIVLQNASGATVASYEIASSPRVTVSGSTLAVDVAAELTAGTSYRVQLAAGAVADIAGNPLATASALAFTTAAAPVVTPNALQGTAAADRLLVATAIRTVDGAAGTDTAVFSKARASYTVAVGSSSVTVGDTGGSNVALSNVERLEFSDASLAIDLAGKAGQVAKTLGAVFGAAAVRNAEYAGAGLELLDGGMSYESLMQLALELRLGAGATSTQVVDLLYTNVVGIAPSAADRAPLVALLDGRSLSAAALGVIAADTSLNAANIDLVGLSTAGLVFS